MNSETVIDSERKSFSKYENLVLVRPSGAEILYRYLDEDDDKIYVVKIGEAKSGGKLKVREDDANKKNRQYLQKSEVLRMQRVGLVRRVEERGIPPQMQDDAAIDASVEREQETRGADVKDMATRRRMMAYIDASEGRPFADPRLYTEVIKRIVAVFKVDRKTAEKYYERHLFYGGHRNANAVQYWKKGGTAPKRGMKVNGKYVNWGRPTSSERLDPESKFGRRQLRPNLLTRWINFVCEHAHEGRTNITTLYERFKMKLVGFNRNADGEIAYYPWDPKRYPPEASMLKEGQRALLETREEIRRRKSEGKRRGRTSQLADGDLDVLDIDGTVCTNFLRFGDDIIQLDGALNPTILIATDRGSRAIVGWYVTYGTENADSYLACVFSAFTDKERELLRWGVPHLDGMVYGCARTIFVDRGPGISEKVQEAVVSRMRKHLLMAEPGNPAGKGDVENLIGIVQKELGNLPGSTYQEPVKGSGQEKHEIKKQNRMKLKDAPKGAVITLRQFMQALLTAISEHNLTADVTHLRTKAMAEQKRPVRPVPKEVYLYNKHRPKGDASWDWPEEKVFRQLSKPFKRVARDGVVNLGKNRTYTSPLLQQRAFEYQKRTGGKALEVEGFELFTSPLHLLWDDDGKLELLDATDGVLQAYGDGYKFLHDYLASRANADLAKARYDSRKHPTVDSVIAKNPVSKTKQSDMAKVDGITAVTKREAKAAATARTQLGDTLELVDMLNGATHVAAAVIEPAAESATFSLIDNTQQIDIDW